MAGDTVPTVKVKPWGKDQGEFVEINQADYEADPKAYVLHDPLDHDGDGKKGGSLPKSERSAPKRRARKVAK